jgi:hypothetical protein
MCARRLLVALVLVIAACDSGGSAPATTAPATTTATTTTTSPTTTTVGTTTTTAVVGVDVLALPVAGEMGPEWIEEIFIPYGDTEQTLGTSPGGEGGTMDLGPEFGAQAPDGTWWFLDAAKGRLARYDSDGTYRDALTIPEDVLVNGVYFQFQLPRVLADGTLVAFGLRVTTTDVLRATNAGIDQVTVDALVVPKGDDGTLAYGFDDTGAIGAVDPVAGTVAPADWFVTQTGARYRFELTDAGLRIELPDAPVPVDRVVPIVTAADPTVNAFGGLEVATTADGRIHLLVVGASEADETTQLAGYTTILPDGTVTPILPLRNPYTLSDPGSPGHLGAAFGASEPWLMFIDTDGVRIYRPVETG